MRITPAFAITGAASALLVLAACSNQPVTPIPPSAEPPAGSRAVTGTVWQYGPNGVRPASAGTVVGWIEVVGSERTLSRAPIASDGRFQFAAPEGARVHVTGPFYQPCAASTTITGDVAVDIHGVSDSNQLGANLPAALLSQQPTLSGTVYEQTPQGRFLLAGATVQLHTLSGQGPIIATTRTDAQGRYVLCGVPTISGLAVLASLIEFVQVSPATDLTGVTTHDIEMRSWS